jgi:hypothetical protein
MGLLKGVIEGSLETAYRSLKYNNDSNQPYIVVPIPGYTDESRANFLNRAPDFFLRQGALSLTNARTGVPEINIGGDITFAQLGLFGINPNIAFRIQSNPFDIDVPVPTDALRVGRFLFDTKNLAGTLFSVKQNLLERTRVNAPGAGRRVYVPYSTILQAAGNPFGFHLDKTGLNPLDFDRRGYFDVTLENERNLGNSGNRLVLIYQTKQIGSPTVEETLAAESLYDIDTTDEAYIYSYRGGPDSFLGLIGKTRIRIDGTGYGSPRDRTNNYNPSALRFIDRNTYVFGNSLIESQLSFFYTGFKDFRQTINEFVDPEFRTTPDKQVLPYTDYNVFNRDRTYGENVPVFFSTVEEKNAARLNPNRTTVYDKFNATPVITIRNNAEVYNDVAVNPDLIPFFFQILNNDNIEDRQDDWFLFFRAYITNMSDSFKADWQSFKYIGRAENFYKYNGFSRDMSLSFTVYAHSRKEMLPLYNKLNYLVGTTAPNYSYAGYMRGMILKATIGDYLSNVPIIINNISLKPSFEAGWDINRGENGEISIEEGGAILPKMIEVDLSFTPLHNFTPQFGERFITAPAPIELTSIIVNE